MENVKNCDSYISILFSQAYRSNLSFSVPNGSNRLCCVLMSLERGNTSSFRKGFLSYLEYGSMGKVQNYNHSESCSN
jgi:hypothetical protein